jgi:phosphoglycolate phosphatase-like HAD superfamily hydrolase
MEDIIICNKEILSSGRQFDIKHIIFDFDGTISLLREGWQYVMREVMVESICGERAPTEEIINEVEDYISASTGIQTIFQMEHLVELVKKYNLVKEEKILSPYEYKKIYTERLHKHISDRIRSIEEGKAPREKFILPGAEEFLFTLSQRRCVKLYLISGTDEEDTKREALLLGVDKYFSPHIYGAIDENRIDIKEFIISKIVADNFLADGKGELLIIGDGPVEISIGKKYNALTIGVCSDEIRGYGWNEKKRERLLSAGADVLIPNFVNKDELLKLIF